MKIDLKLDSAQLEAINHTWQYLGNVATTEIDFRTSRARAHKVIVSVLTDIAKKFQKKGIDKANSSKPFKITLSYHEAHFLERFLIHTRLLDDYDTNVQRQIIFQLNRQLA